MWQRGVTVVIEQFVKVEEFPFHPVIALRDIITADNRINQRLDGFILELVAQVHGTDPGTILPQPVVDHLIGQQGIENMGKHMQLAA